jgi:hypothetical protein
MARRVQMIKVPFDYHWSRMAVTSVTELGPQLLKDEVAEEALVKGYAIELPDKTPPPKRSTRRRAPASNTRRAT